MDSNLLHQFFTFKSIFEGLEDAVICYDLNFSITIWNAAAERLFGYSKEEALGHDFFMLVPEACCNKQQEMMHALLKGNKLNHFHSECLLKSGIHIPVFITLSPIKDGNGIVIGASQIVTDITKQRLAEQQQAMLASIIEGSEDAIVSKTLDGVITSWNKGAENIFGYNSAEIIGKHITVLMPFDKLEEEDYIISNVRQGKKIEHFQTIRISKRGTLIPVSLTVSPIRDHSGNIIGISKIARDISAQRLADEKQSILAAIVESSDDAIVSKTLEGIIMTWNKGAENIFQYSEAEAIGKHITMLLPRDRFSEEQRIIDSIKKGEKVDHYHTIRLRKDGREIEVSLTVSPIRSIDGVIIGASKVARDITASRKAEIALENKSQKLLILNTIGKSISEQLDIDTILQKVTDATTRLTGAAFGAFFYNKMDESGASYLLYALSGAPREAFDKLGMPRNTALFHTTFNGEGVVRVSDITKDPRYGHMAPHFGMPQGHLPVVSYLAVPVVSSSGTVIGGLFFGHPQPGMFIAEHEDLVLNVASQAAIALDNSKLFEEVKSLSKKKDEFIAIASHELKTPLTSMSGYLQLLQKTVQPGINAQFVDKAVRQIDKLNTLINDLLDISKVQAGKLQFNVELVNLSAIILDARETFEQSAPQHKINCFLEDEIMVMGDKIRLEQVITNLISNAIKYAPEVPEIDINVVNRKADIMVSIKDYGAGIRTEDQVQLFSQFYRVSESSRNVQGLGLGLYITKEIIERHGGKIWVESEPGNGATFIFTIPKQ